MSPARPVAGALGRSTARAATYLEVMTTSGPDLPAARSRAIAWHALGVFLIVAGMGHLVAPDEFLAQVPPWLPGWLPDPSTIVLLSGLVELALGASVLLLRRRRRVLVGWIIAGFFLVIFPGNISQAVTGTDAFGLESATARVVRLAFQPLLIAWALWASGAWYAWRRVSKPQQPTSRGSAAGTPPGG